MSKTIWSKTKAEFVVEIIHDQLGPRSSWPRKTRAANPRYRELCRQLAEVIGCKPGGIDMTVQVAAGVRSYSDPRNRKWTFWLIAKALEIGFITPEETPVLQ